MGSFGGDGRNEYQVRDSEQALKDKLSAYSESPQEYKRRLELEKVKQAREDDLAQGRNRGQELFGTGSLGRVEEGRAKEISDIIARRQKESEGFTAEEQNAMRDNNLTTTNQSLAGQMRQMKIQQAQSGVRGGLASAQQAKLLADAQGANVASERDLFLKNIDARRAGLESLEKSTNTARQEELGRQQFNIDSLNREKMAQLATELGYGELGSGERSGLYQKWAGEENAAATREAAKKEGGGCCFIFLEARYGNGTMDSVVRQYRNEHMTDRNKRGYYKLSEVLVPLMRKSKVAKIATRVLMTDPMVAYGKAYYGKGSKLGFIFKPITKFWLRLFNYLGDDHPFVRENGEVI